MVEKPKVSLKGWAPKSEYDRSNFQTKCANLSGLGLQLEDLEQQIKHIGTSIQFVRSPPSCHQPNSSSNLSEAKSNFSAAAANTEERKIWSRKIKKIKRANARLRNTRALKALSHNRMAHRQGLTCLEINGSLCANRQAWLQAAADFGNQRFGDENNKGEAQEEKLKYLKEAADHQRLDGRPAGQLEFFDVLQARAEMKSGKSAGRDGIPNEIYKELPFLLVWEIAKLFRQRFADLDEASPSTWKILEFIGIPKGCNVQTFDEFRWLSKINCFQKWYIRSLRPTYRSMFTTTEVNTMGFKPVVSTDDLVAPLRQILHSAYEWMRPVVVAAQDIQWAFDSMDHGFLMSSLLRRGLPAHMTANLLRELFGFEAQIRLPNAGVSPPFRFDRGGKQGGVETPDQFNAMLEAIMEPAVVSWRVRKFGVKVDMTVARGSLI